MPRLSHFLACRFGVFGRVGGVDARFVGERSEASAVSDSPLAEVSHRCLADVPQDDQPVADQHERDGALDREAGAVARLAGGHGRSGSASH